MGEKTEDGNSKPLSAIKIRKKGPRVGIPTNFKEISHFKTQKNLHFHFRLGTGYQGQV